MNTEAIYSKSDLEKLLKSENKKEIIDFLLYIGINETDAEWAQDVCISFSSHKDEDISGLAITCIGHSARINRATNKERVISFLKEKLNDPRLSGRAQDAIDDIDIFVKDASP